MLISDTRASRRRAANQIYAHKRETPVGTTRSVRNKASRTEEVLEFWEYRSGRKLTSREASEMQSNIEGVIALLAQWDRADREAVRGRKKHDTPKD